MQTTTTKVQTAFRFDKELIRRLKIKAKKENRSLNNYVETILMDVVYDEPNEETMAAIDEVKSGKDLKRLDMDKFDEFVAGL
jgi:plasmid stability protein